MSGKVNARPLCIINLCLEAESVSSKLALGLDPGSEVVGPEVSNVGGVRSLGVLLQLKNRLVKSKH